MTIPTRRGQRAIPEEAGYTLMEILVVISIILLVTLIAIPNLPGMKIQVNENAAIQALRNIYQSQQQFQSRYPTVGFACQLPALGGSPATGEATAEHAKVLPGDIASGRKSGYSFSIIHCVKASGTSHGTNQATVQDQTIGYEAIAIPQALGKTGHRGFCIDQQGEVKADPAGGTACTQSLQ